MYGSETAEFSCIRLSFMHLSSYPPYLGTALLTALFTTRRCRGKGKGDG